MTCELEAFRAVNFDWTRQLKSIWRDPRYHVSGLHRQTVDDLVNYFFSRTIDVAPDDEPLGRVIIGPKGFGKTHLIGELRRRNAELPCLLRHLEPVLVSARHEEDVAAGEAVEAGDRIGGDHLIGVADMRLAVRVSDRRGDVERLGHEGRLATRYAPE